VEREFTQAGSHISARVSADPNRAAFGWYLLLVLVDDIPPEGRIVRIMK
jgi:hypothetical protein